MKGGFPVHAPTKKLGELLVEAGLLTSAQLSETLRHQRFQGGRMGSNLVSLGFISEEVLLDFLAQQTGVPRLDPQMLENIKPEVLKRIPQRMAEQLTDYLSDNGVKVRYLHSDVDTVERVEILRDLRLGAFDVLVGINLLREGLDIPEVSLVAILDADKEGFLRAERSLIQTIGRAARNVNGRAILYADRITDSMKKAMFETERRRNKQIAHNLEHGITPKSVVKRIKDLIDGVYSEKSGKEAEKLLMQKALVEDMSEKDVAREIKRLEKQMVEHAKNLEFEKAAKVRDQLHVLKEQAFGAPGSDNVLPMTATGSARA